MEERSPGFTLRQLEYLLAVVEAGSLSRASELHHFSETAASWAINELEKSLGAQLLVRRRARGVTPTRTGERVLAQARVLLREASRLEDLASEEQPIAGPVWFGMTPGLSPLILPAMITTIAARHPGAELRYSLTQIDALRRELLDGRLDLAAGIFDPMPDSLEGVPLFTDEVVVLLAADHPLASLDALTLEQLATEPLVLLDSETAVGNALELYRAAGIDPWIAHQSASSELVASLVSAGLGYSFQLRSLTRAMSYAGHALRTVPLRTESQTVHDVSAVWPRATGLNRRGAAILAAARSIEL